MKAHLPRPSLKFAVLAPLTLALVAMGIAFTYSFSRQEEAFTKDFVDGAFVSAHKAFDSAVADETEKLTAVTALLVRDEGLRRAMLSKERQALLRQSKPILDQLRKESGITHLYFHTPDRINFLRVHQPERFGDKIARHTAITAESSGKPASGLELGPLGTFTLRVVFPWYHGSRLIGYIELGQEIEHILTRINSLSGVDLYMIIDKNHLSRQEWTRGMSMLGRQAEWDLLDDAVVTYKTGREIMAPIRALLEQDPAHAHDRIRVSDDRRVLQALTVPVSDAAGSEVGHLLLARDTTSLANENRRQTWSVAGLVLAVGSLLIGLFSFLIGRVEKRLDVSRIALANSEKRFRSLVESVNDWIWEIDAEWRYVYASPQVETVLGYKPDEVLGKKPFDLMPEAEGRRIASAFASIARDRRPLSALENLNLHKDGHIVTLETSAVPILQPDGTLSGYRGVDRDVTGRKRAEAALDQTTQRLNLHFQQTPLAVIEWDTDFRVLDWNPAAEAIFGYSRSEAIGRHATDLIIPDEAREQVSRVWQDLLQKKDGFRSTNANSTKDGGVIFCDWYNTPLVDETGLVIGVASLAQDVTEQKQAEERIHTLAYYDELTGLPNRTLFHDRLGQAIATAERHQGSIGVMLLDLDHFKVINDTLGHVAGNSLLQAVAARLKSCLRQSDTVARLGGDEFAIALAEIGDVEDVAQIASKILSECENPFTLAGNELFVSCSIGISLYPSDGDDIHKLIRNADSALYQAKDQGRNNFQFYSTAMTTRIAQRLALETDLRHALERDEFILHYQPLLDAATGTVAGVEALVRWQHPERGLVSPAEFIPLAEESGLIIPIGEWILRTACSQAKAWQEAGMTDLRLAINVSARQFKQGQLVPLLRTVLAETGLPPHDLELEITESLLIEDTGSAVAAMLAELKQTGITLAVDDFGTGYSSLSYLKRFPIDKLKIDQSFVRGISTNPEDASLVQAIIAIARSLHLEVIAEGVETEDQIRFLRRHHCDYLQGYLFSPPIQAEAFAELVRSGRSLPRTED